MNTVQQDFANRVWDFVVVGTGMGGGVIGHALARKGKEVLFCEKGRAHFAKKDAIYGEYAENYFTNAKPSPPESGEIFSRAGRYWEEIEDVTGPRSYRFLPFIGLGAGGSSALYGMALERFFPRDFRPGESFNGVPGANLPPVWPISYEDLEPFYIAAERLFRVRGSADPLKKDLNLSHLLEAPPASPVAEEMTKFFVGKGFHPYRIPLGCEFVEGCVCCQSYLCEKDCKNDSTRICLRPAIEEHGAQILELCDVLQIDGEGSRVSGIVCRYRGGIVKIKARNVILAAGALETPRILLNSVTKSWSKGCANSSGMVGKNLMRHYIDLFAVKPEASIDFTHNLKEIALNDFYEYRGKKFGTLQSFGHMPPPEILVDGLVKDVKAGRVPGLAPWVQMCAPALKALFSKIFAKKLVFATIMEDLPYLENRVLAPTREGAGAGPLRICYGLSEFEKKRIKEFREIVMETLKPFKPMLIKQAENNQRIAHACGTCRMGDDPAESVIDGWNKAHDLDNLFIVDASFFPSSGGTNPALTIAANALRVAEKFV